MLLRLHDKSMIMGSAALPRHQTGLRGMMMAAMMYARIPLPPIRLNSAQIRRTTVGSMPKY